MNNTEIIVKMGKGKNTNTIYIYNKNKLYAMSGINNRIRLLIILNYNNSNQNKVIKAKDFTPNNLHNVFKSLIIMKKYFPELTGKTFGNNQKIFGEIGKEKTIIGNIKIGDILYHTSHIDNVTDYYKVLNRTKKTVTIILLIKNEKINITKGENLKRKIQIDKNEKEYIKISSYLSVSK